MTSDRPTLLSSGLPAGGPLAPAALLQATAIVGFALAFVAKFRRSDRRRVGFYGELLASFFGILGVLLGLHVATMGPTPALLAAHYRLTFLGFLGLTIVGIAFRFYPPTAATESSLTAVRTRSETIWGSRVAR